MKITSRLPDVGTTIFTTMSRLAQEHGAINLSQGFPDFDVSQDLIDLVKKHMDAGHNQYAPMAGATPLREALSRLIKRAYGRGLDAENEILVTAGATQAIFSAVAAFVNPGDEVIIFDPSYDSYAPAVRLNGGVPVHIDLVYPTFRIDWDDVRRRIRPRTRMIIINSPHNPLGTILSDEDMRELEAIVVEYGLVLISDEVYERLIFDGNIHQSVLRFPDLFRHSVACFSFGKTFHATGWKIGYVAGPASLVAEIRKAHQFIVFSVNTPLQLAIAEYLEDPSRYEQLGPFYQKKRDFFLEKIKNSPFTPLKTSGSYFQLLSYSGFSSRADTELAVELTIRHKIASIPVSVFYHDRTDHRLLRFCFAKKEETLEKAAHVLSTLKLL